MLKAVAWTAVIAGSLGAAMACSSKSSGGNGFGGEGDASNTEGEDSGGSSSSGGGSSSGGTSCSNPLAEVSLLGLTLPSTCEPCLQMECNDGGSWAACATESCTTCSTPLIACAEGVCASACTPAAPEGGASSSSGGSSSDASSSGSSSTDAGAPDCAKLMSCSGCSLIGAASSSEEAPCNSAVSSNDETECAGYLATLQAVSSTLCP